jgi:hypothetical protein
MQDRIVNHSKNAVRRGKNLGIDFTLAERGEAPMKNKWVKKKRKQICTEQHRANQKRK